MGVVKRLLPLWFSLMLTPIAIFVGLWSVGAGEGNYVVATILFPFSIITGVIIRPIFSCPEFGDCFPRDAVWLASAVFQFPIYGLLFTFIYRKVPLIILLALFHISCFVCFWLHFGTVGFK
jgi:energy-converting hydrogenase Eha subunit A